jgi:hypothetical protein
MRVTLAPHLIADHDSNNGERSRAVFECGQVKIAQRRSRRKTIITRHDLIAAASHLAIGGSSESQCGGSVGQEGSATSTLFAGQSSCDPSAVLADH